MKKRIIFLTAFTLSGALSGCGNTIDNIDETTFYEDYKKHQYIVSYYLDENNEKQFGCIDYKGNEIVEFNKKSIYVGNTGIISVNEEDSAYFIKDNKIVETNHKQIFEFHNNSALVQNSEGYYGVIDSSLNYVINPIFTNALMSSKNVHLVSNDEGNYFIYNNVYTKCDGTFARYVNLLSETHAAAVIIKDSKYGVINNYGDVLVNPEYKSISLVSDTAICIGFDNSQTLIDLNSSKILITVPYGSSNILLAKSSKYYAYAKDSISTIVINNRSFKLPADQIVLELYPEFVYARDFKTNNQLIYNLRGKLLIDNSKGRFSSVSNDGTVACYIDTNNVNKIINSSGRVLSKLSDAMFIGMFGHDNFMFKKNGKFHLYSPSGEILMETDENLLSGSSDKGTFGVAFNLKSSSKYYRNNGELLITSTNTLIVEENAILEYEGEGTNIYDLFGNKIFTSEHKLNILNY